MRITGLLLAISFFFFAASAAQAKGNEACKAKYPAYASYMATQWGACMKAPVSLGQEGLKAWQCWCRKG